MWVSEMRDERTRVRIFFVKNDGLIGVVIGIPLEDITRFRILCPHVSTGRSLDPDYKDLSKRVLTDIEDARLQIQDLDILLISSLAH